jgi:hypothetical protein
MDIRFRDVNYGIVEARAVLKTKEGFMINEITILSKDGKLEVELPQKSFRGKDGKLTILDVITFDDEDKKTLFLLEIKNEFIDWRKKQKKVRVYEPGESKD